MNSPLRISLQPTPEQAARLSELQKAFADVCNALAPIVRERRCWNRVTLHHIAYRQMRDQFPQVGSQMVCNAIHAVCRAARVVFQHPASPFNAMRYAPGTQLPLLAFAEDAPVIFDRHTLSMKDGQLSLYTLDGRMRFKLSLMPEGEAKFRDQRLREVVFTRVALDRFELVFWFVEAEEEDELLLAGRADPSQAFIPSYINVTEPN